MESTQQLSLLSNHASMKSFIVFTRILIEGLALLWWECCGNKNNNNDTWISGCDKWVELQCFAQILAFLVSRRPRSGTLRLRTQPKLPSRWPKSPHRPTNWVTDENGEELLIQGYLRFVRGKIALAGVGKKTAEVRIMSFVLFQASFWNQVNTHVKTHFGQV